MPAMSTSSMTSSDGWGEVARDFLRASQEESDEALKCEACRSESKSSVQTTSDTDDSGPGDFEYQRVQQPRSWWAEFIKIHSHGCGSMKLPKRKISVASACAGIFAEGEALKAAQCGKMY